MAAVLQSVRPDPPSVLRKGLRDGRSPGVLLRRAIVGMSFIGTACMAVTTLFQMGMLKRLADPPIEGFDSDRVNASDTAYGWGMPDSPLSIVSHAMAIAVAAVGGEDRAERKPLVTLAAKAVATPAAVTAARYLFYDMPVKEKGWCPYCIVDGLAHIAVFGFTIWESASALRSLARR